PTDARTTRENEGSVTTTTTVPPSMPRKRTVGAPLAVVLSLLTVFGPISMDLYLPVLPALTADLGSATSTAQLTVTACLFGLARHLPVPRRDRRAHPRRLPAGLPRNAACRATQHRRAGTDRPGHAPPAVRPGVPRRGAGHRLRQRRPVRLPQRRDVPAAGGL